MVPLGCHVMDILYHLITMVLWGSITIMDGVISVMITTIVLLKLMLFVINWDILEHQVTLELDYWG